MICEEVAEEQHKEISTLAEHFEIVFDTRISISSDNLRTVSENIFNGDETYRGTFLKDDFVNDFNEEEIEERDIGKQWAKLDTLEYKFASAPSFYKTQKDGKIVTTYALNRRKKDSKISSSSKLQLGHSKEFNLKLSNEVFHSLKMRPKHEKPEKYKFLDKEEDQIITDFGLDMFTRFLLYQMINNQILERVHDVISIGKEAIVLLADLDPSLPLDPTLPKQCAIKIFRMTNLEIKQIDTYINNHASNDKIVTESVRKAINTWNKNKKLPTHLCSYRKVNDRYVYDRKEIKYPQYLHSHNTLVDNSVDELVTRKTVRNLAENEMNVLIRLQKAQIPSPKFIKLKTHVLVMSFIGENNMAAPSLKDANMTTAEYIVAYNQVIEGMKTMFEKANVIHTDLLDNILWHQGQCYFIDFSQSVELYDPHSFSYLFDDCANVTDFFTKKGVPDVRSEYDLYKYITGFDFCSSFNNIEKS